MTYHMPSLQLVGNIQYVRNARQAEWMLAFIDFERKHCRRHATAVRKHDNPLAHLEHFGREKRGNLAQH